MNTLKLNPTEKRTLELRQIVSGATTFSDAVARLQGQAGLREGAAIRQAARLRPALYDAWCQKGRPQTL